MNDVFGVRRRQTVRDLLRVLDRPPWSKRSLIQLLAQFLPFKQFGNDVGGAFVNTDIEYSQYIRVIQASRCACFLFETAQAVRIARISRGEDFDGDVSIQARIARAINFTHSATSQQRRNFIVAELLAGQDSPLLGGRRLRAQAERRDVEEAVRLVVAGEQGFDFTSQRFVGSACLSQERGALPGRKLPGSAE